MNTDRHAVCIPAMFWNDHAARAPYDDGDTGPACEWRGGSRVTVVGTVAELGRLLADAKFYADRESMDECPRRLRESARRTVAALEARLADLQDSNA
jgi:hypothetical protein